MIKENTHTQGCVGQQQKIQHPYYISTRGEEKQNEAEREFEKTMPEKDLKLGKRIKPKDSRA